MCKAGALKKERRDSMKHDMNYNIIKHQVLSNIESLIDKQNKKGFKKYGESLEQCGVDDYDWQQMIIEELIDALQYQQKEIKRLKEELNEDLPIRPEVST